MASNPQQQQSSMSSPHPPHPLIWFQLLDSATGQSYKGTSASSVSLHPGSVVDQFRKEVKAEYADSHLSGIAPSDLLVYKNMAAFNNSRNSDQEREHPLEEDCLIDGLGRSKKEALIVIVPRPVDSEGRHLAICIDNDSYRHYLLLGERLKDTRIIQNLVALIKSIQEAVPSEINQIPFLFIDGSSGMGKTQSAFSLMAAGIDVRFIPSDKVVDQSQAIYKCFKSYSDLFLDCVHKDVLIMKESQSPLPLCCNVYGFILALLSENQYFNGAATRSEVQSRLGALKKKPVIFLDEFPIILKGRNNESDSEKLRFMRNIFRSFKLVVIVSSTNSSAANIVESGSNSRKGIGLDAQNVLWCHIVPFCYPSFQSCKCHPIPSEFDFMLPLLENSRPLFSSLAVKFFRTKSENWSSMVDFLDQMTAYIASEVKTSKQADAAVGGNFFLLGQLHLFLSASYANRNTQDDYKNLLIHRHFANLIEDSVFPIFLNAHGLVTEEEEVWIQRVAFPPFKQDILLYLSLMGGLGNHAIQGIDGKRIPFAAGLSLMESVLTFSPNYANSNQKSNDGMRLEALLAASVVLASHANGFRGIALSKLLGELCYEISFTEQVLNLIDIPKEAQNLLNTVIPYLAPPNQKLPEYLSCLGVTIQMGECERLANEDRCDFSAYHGFLTGECKDYRKPLDLSDVERILDRIPEKSRVHLVLTNRIQNSYYSGRGGSNPNAKRSYDEFVRGCDDRKERLTNCHIFRLDKVEGDSIRLIKIEGLSLTPDSANDNETANRLVIFIPVPEKPKINHQ